MIDPLMSTLRARGLLTPPFPLWSMLADAANRAPDGVWFRVRDESMTYAQGFDAARRLASALKARGVGNGDRVAICMPNHPSFGVAAHAAWLMGATVVPMHPAYAAATQAKQLELVEPAVIITSSAPALLTKLTSLARTTGIRAVLVSNAETLRGRVDLQQSSAISLASELAGAEPLPQQDFNSSPQLALLQFTGGTTGTPKAAMLTHRAVSTNVGQIALALERLQPELECALAAAPFAHVVGINGVMNLMTYFRSKLLIEPVFEMEQAARTCVEHGVSFLAGPPTLFAGFAATDAARSGSLRSIKYVVCGGAPLPSEVKTRFEALTGGTMLSGYGMTEASCTVSVTRPQEPFTSGSVGRPVSGTTIEIIPCENDERTLQPGDAGEICVRGPQIMDGYWRNPGETAIALRDGRIHTGDLGRFIDGQLFIVDRLKDIIIASGYNVYPANVEEAMYRHPAVLEAAAVGHADAYRGETVVAVVVLRPGERLTLEELQVFLKDRLSPMEIPKSLQIRDSLPKSPAGKILRRAIRESLAASS